jgi:hypothetical protein
MGVVPFECTSSFLTKVLFLFDTGKVIDYVNFSLFLEENFADQKRSITFEKIVYSNIKDTKEKTKFSCHLKIHLPSH